MNSLWMASIVFACCFGAALSGMFLHVKVPDTHLDSSSREVVKLVMGLIATMTALVLSLLIASAKTSYDTQSNDLQQLSVAIVQLDRVLAHYGPEAKATRDLLRAGVVMAHAKIWTSGGVRAQFLDPTQTTQQADILYDRLRNLAPSTDAQRLDQNNALRLSSEINRTRVLMFEQIGGDVSWPFVTVMVFWVSMLFLGFGLFARFNVTVMAALIIGALSVASGIFLILDLNQPFSGLMQLSDAPFRHALARLDQ